MTNAEVAAYFAALAPDEQAEIIVVDGDMLSVDEETIYSNAELHDNDLFIWAAGQMDTMLSIQNGSPILFRRSR